MDISNRDAISTVPASTTNPSVASSNGYLLGLLAMIAVIGAMTALWSALNIHNGLLNGWLSLPTALDAVILLRLAGTSRGVLGASLAVGATLTTAAAAVWITAATRIGRVMGMTPMDSLQRMDPMLTWEVAREAATATDWLLLVASSTLAVWLMRRR